MPQNLQAAQGTIIAKHLDIKGLQQDAAAEAHLKSTWQGDDRPQDDPNKVFTHQFLIFAVVNH